MCNMALVKITCMLQKTCLASYRGLNLMSHAVENHLLKIIDNGLKRGLLSFRHFIEMFDTLKGSLCVSKLSFYVLDINAPGILGAIRRKFSEQKQENHFGH